MLYNLTTMIATVMSVFHTKSFQLGLLN